MSRYVCPACFRWGILLMRQDERVYQIYMFHPSVNKRCILGKGRVTAKKRRRLK